METASVQGGAVKGRRNSRLALPQEPVLSRQRVRFVDERRIAKRIEGDHWRRAFIRR